MNETVIAQLKESCDCLKQTDDNEFIKDVNQLVDMISILTCWKHTPCDTFLKCKREEIFEPCINQECGCDYGLTHLDLYYPLVDVDTIKVQFQVKDGIHFQLIDVDKSLFSYDEFEGRIWIDMSDFIENDCGCCSPEIVKFIVTYEAGYDKIPDCLIPVFCDYLDYVIEMNKCECGCDECDEGEDNIYNSDNSEEQASTYEIVKQHIITLYARQLESISLCTGEPRFWGMVV